MSYVVSYEKKQNMSFVKSVKMFFWPKNDLLSVKKLARIPAGRISGKISILCIPIVIQFQRRSLVQIVILIFLLLSQKNLRNLVRAEHYSVWLGTSELKRKDGLSEGF